MTARRRPGLAWVVVLSVIEMIAVAAGAGPPVQPLLSVLFVLTCPGFLLIDLPNPRDPVARVVLGIGGSLAINASLVSISLVGDIRPVAPVLVLALAFVALLPRATLRRWIGSIRSLVGRTDVGQEAAATSAAEDRLTPVFVDRHATAVAEPPATPTEEETAPVIADIASVKEPSEADGEYVDASSDDEPALVEEDDLATEDPALLAEEPSEDEDKDEDGETALDDESVPVEEDDLATVDTGLVTPVSYHPTDPEVEDLAATPEEAPAPLEQYDLPQATDETAVTEESAEEGDAADISDDQDVPSEVEDVEPVAPLDESETETQDDDHAKEYAVPFEEEDLATADIEEALPPEVEDADIDLIAPLVTDDSSEVDAEDIPEVATEEDVVALLEELRAADDDFEAEPPSEDTAGDDADVDRKDSVAEAGGVELHPEVVPPPPVHVSATEDTAEQDTAEQDTAEQDTAGAQQETSTEEIVEDAAPLPPTIPVPPVDPIEIEPQAVVLFGVDINQAGVESIAAFPGMTPEPAELIVAYRDRHGPFRDARALLDLMRAIEAREQAKRR